VAARQPPTGHRRVGYRRDGRPSWHHAQRGQDPAASGSPGPPNVARAGTGRQGMLARGAVTAKSWLRVALPAPARMDVSYSCSRIDRWKTTCPGTSLLELRRNANEQILPSVGCNEMCTDGQPISIPIQWQRNRRLAGDMVFLPLFSS
jgi:hypothetical protein